MTLCFRLTYKVKIEHGESMGKTEVRWELIAISEEGSTHLEIPREGEAEFAELMT